MCEKTPIRFIRFIVLGFLLFSILACNEAKEPQLIHLKDYMIETALDATPVVVKALEDCKVKGVKKIIFPKGTYHFYPTFAPDRYCAITNNDNGLKRTAFPLIDFHDFEIDGNGSEFIFHGKMVPFIIEESSNITVRNFSIDWDVPFTLEGLVVNNNPSDNTFDIEVKTPYKVQYGRLYLSLEREDSPYEKKYGKRFATAEQYDIEVGQNIIWDPKTMAPIYNTKQYEINQKGIEAIELEKGLVRLKSKGITVPPVGSIFVSKGEYLQNRTSPAIRVFKSKDLLFKDVNIYHAGAMGLIAERSENITLDSFNVVLKENSGRMVTTTADATHFCNVKGKVIIRNCTFENMLDDATNIHGTYVRVNKIIDDYSLAVETYHPHQNGYLFGEAGDEVQIINKETLQPTTEPLVLKEVKRINEKISIITFDRSIKGKVDLYYGVENISWYPSALIENNIVRNNRARSFLISTPREVIVRNNFLSSQMASLRMTGDLGLWNESGPCGNLIIENNTFENCVYGGNGAQSIIMIDPQYVNNNIKSKYSKNITIKNNVIKTFDASILFAMSVDGLIFEDNRIEQTNAFKPIFPDTPNLKIINSDNVSIQRNTYSSISGEKGTLFIDDKSKQINIDELTPFLKIN